MRGCATALVGSVVLLSGSLGGLAGEEIAGDERVLAGGGVGQAEDQGQVQRVGPGVSASRSTRSRRMRSMLTPCRCRFQLR